MAPTQPDQAGLNPSQREAVRCIDGPLLVLAGAGSGKTRVITHKIAYLIATCGYAPRHVAAVTFTNRAAREMKARVGGLLSRADTRGLTVSTFHTLGLDLLRREQASTRLRPGFSILDEQDTVALVRESAGAGGETLEAAPLRARISRLKSALIPPEQALARAADEEEGAAARLYAAYERALTAYNAVDFDDLIALPARLLATDDKIRERWQGRIRYLLVDEYQDTNDAQYQLMRLLVGVGGALTVVGDDDQSIYAWRGARPENLRHLRDDFPNLRVVKLEQNYRSSGCILGAANRLIANNPHVYAKKLWSALGHGELLRVLSARDEVHEAEWVVSELMSHHFRSAGRYRDYAILYRSNHQARLFERVLRERRVPYFLSGGTSFFARAEVRDAMGYARLLANPDDDAAFLRVVNTPRREIGATTLEQLGAYAAGRGVSLYAASLELGAEHNVGRRGLERLRQLADLLQSAAAVPGRPGDAVDAVLARAGYPDWVRDAAGEPKTAERRLQNVADLVEWMNRLAAEDPATDLAAIVARLTLQDILDRQDEDRQDDRVTLMTLHAAKGLEFPHVFMVGMEEDLLPHHGSIGEEGLQEERRLCYVGITRAQRTLTFSLTARRKRFGDWESREPSRFLGELPEAALRWEGTRNPDEDPEQKRERGQRQIDGLRALLQSG